MGVMVTGQRRRSLLLILVLFLLTAVVLALSPRAAGAAGPPLTLPTDNASGRYDTLVLRDLGKKTGAVVAMVAENGRFTARQLWRSKTGKLDVGKAKWLAADVNADGLADGVALMDLGRGRSRFVVYLNSGDAATPKTFWTSKKGAFVWAKAKLAVADTDGDGRDDVLALYDRGRAGLALYSFVSTGSAFRMSTGWTGSLGVSFASTQLAAGDVTADGKDDALTLTSSGATSELTVFARSGTKFTKRSFWRGVYPAAGAQLAAGDVDSDGDFDALCLRRAGGDGRLDVFLSSTTAFAAPLAWYQGATLPGAGARLAVGDLNGDGRADAIIAAASGSASSRLVVAVSDGARFAPGTWWSGAWPLARLRLACAPSPGLVISDQAEVLDASTLAALAAVAADGTLTFSDETAQLGQLAPGDVLISAPDTAHPEGIFRRVESISEAGGDVTVTTTQAALDDVVENGEVAFVKHVTAGDLSQADVTLPGARLTSRAGDPLITIAIETTLKAGDGVGGEVSLKGSISLDPLAYFSYSTSYGVPTSISYTQVMNATSALDVTVKAALSKEIEQEIIEAPLGTMMVVVPPAVPIWVTPTFQVYVGAEGEVAAGVTAGLTETCVATVNLSYSGGRFHTPTATTETTRAWRKPTLFGDIELRAYAGASLEFLLYSVAGPYASIEAGPCLEAGTNRTPWWELFAAVDFEIGVTLDLRLVELKSNFPAWRLYKYPIDWARTPYGTQGVGGKVTAADTGAPLAGATVKLRQGASNPSGSVWGTTATAADGTYSFTGPPAGQYTLVATKAGYQSGQRDTTVVANEMTEGQDIALVPRQSGGAVSGRIKDAAVYDARIAGATVELRQGLENPTGTLFASTTSAVDGLYEFRDVPAGSYTVVARKTGYLSNSRSVTIGDGDNRIGHDILLTPVVAGAIAQATDVNAFIRYPEGVGVLDAGNALLQHGTYEFWFKTTVDSEIERSGVLAMVSMAYFNWPDQTGGNAPIMKILVDGRGTITYGINEYDGGGPLNGTWHFIRGATEPQPGQWIHIAAQFGSAGMRLYVNGHLEASDPYTGYPQPDWSDGTLAGGWFSLGDNETKEPGGQTARGYYKELRVSQGQRYQIDFTPPATVTQDGATALLDHLIGGTTGENHGFVWLP